MSNKWMSKLSGDFAKVSSEMEVKKDLIKLASPSFNWSTGSGGVPVGKGVCFYGGENSGKSLLMQLMFAEIQRKDPEAICILFDAEFSHNPEWFKKLGGDPSRLVVRQTNDPLQIFDYMWGEMLELLQDGCPIKGIGIDSVHSILYPNDIKDQSTKVTMGGSGAKYLGSALKRVLPIIREYNITTVLVQQVYEELDPMKALANPYKVPDGRALKHFCDLMIQVDRLDTKAGRVENGQTIAGGAQQIGHKIRLKNKKNRVGSPYRVAEFTLNYEKGIVDVEDEAINLAKSLGVIYHPINPVSGKPNAQSWQFGDHEAVRGEDNMRKWLKSSPQLISELIEACNGANDDAVKARLSQLEDEQSTVDLDVELE